MNAGGDVPQDFQHNEIADNERAIGLLGGKAPDLRILRKVEFRRARGWNETDLTLGQRKCVAQLQLLNDATRKGIDCEAIGEYTHAAPGPDTGQGELLGERSARAAFPGDRQRQHVAFETALNSRLHLGQHDIGHTGQLHSICDCQRAELLTL